MKRPRPSSDQPTLAPSGALAAPLAAAMCWIVGQAWAARPWMLAALVACVLADAIIPASLTLIFGHLVGVLTARAGTQPETGAFLDAALPWLLWASGLLLLSGLASAARNLLQRLLADELNLSLAKALLAQVARLDVAQLETKTVQVRRDRAMRARTVSCASMVYAAANIAAARLQVAGLFVVLVWLAPLVSWLLILGVAPLLGLRWYVLRMRHHAQVAKTAAS